MKQVHGRESHRIEIKLRCYVTSPPVWAGGAMHIENIGRNGLLLVWHSQNGVPMPAVGQLITLEVELPADHGFGPKCIHCQGAITRISTEDGDSPRVAVSLNYMDFRPLTGRQGALEPISGKTISPMA